MRRILYFGLIVLAVAAIAACSSSSSGTSTHTYIVGAIGSAYNSHVPVFWKDGVLQPTLSNTGGGRAASMTEDKSGNIYICGNNGTGPGYWKNGTWNALLVGSYSGVYAIDIAVDSHGNVWMTGSDSTSDLLVWENTGSPTAIDTGHFTGSGGGIQADLSGNVYVSVTDNSGGPSLPAYAKSNGTTTTGGLMPLLATSNSNGDAGGFTLDSSGNVYYVGITFGSASQGPVYWKTTSGTFSGNPTQLNLGSNTANAYWDQGGVALDSNGNVGAVMGYASSGAASYFAQLLYWKTPTSAPVAIDLPGTYTLAYWVPVRGVAFDSNNNLILADQVGNTWVGSVVGSNLSDGVPVSWQNATPTLLPMGSNTWGIANAVIVGP